MELWRQVDWSYQLEKKSVGVFARSFLVKLKKYRSLEDIDRALGASKHVISFPPDFPPYPAMQDLVEHVVETYGLGIQIRDGALQDLQGELRWPIPEDPKKAALAMSALKRAEPRLEPRPYVRNGSSDTLRWAVFSSLDWADIEAADVYAAHALFPPKRKVPKAPKKAPGEAPRRERLPEHEELLGWVTAHSAEFVGRLVEALDKLETSHAGSTQERDANSQIYRIERRARR